MTNQQALKEAIKLVGLGKSNQVKFAEKLSEALRKRGLDRVISQQIVSYWTRSPYGIPAEFCIDVEELPEVNFQVTKHMLRPDIFGAIPYNPITE